MIMASDTELQAVPLSSEAALFEVRSPFPSTFGLQHPHKYLDQDDKRNAESQGFPGRWYDRLWQRRLRRLKSNSEHPDAGDDLLTEEEEIELLAGSATQRFVPTPGTYWMH